MIGICGAELHDTMHDTMHDRYRAQESCHNTRQRRRDWRTREARYAWMEGGWKEGVGKGSKEKDRGRWEGLRKEGCGQGNRRMKAAE